MTAHGMSIYMYQQIKKNRSNKHVILIIWNVLIVTSKNGNNLKDRKIVPLIQLPTTLLTQRVSLVEQETPKVKDAIPYIKRASDVKSIINTKNVNRIILMQCTNETKKDNSEK